jgi:hypothetical protein
MAEHDTLHYTPPAAGSNRSTGRERAAGAVPSGMPSEEFRPSDPSGPGAASGLERRDLGAVRKRDKFCVGISVAGHALAVAKAFRETAAFL